MFQWQIIINGKPFGKFEADSLEQAIKTARREASSFARAAWKYADAYPNSVRVEYVPTTPRYVESHIVPQYEA